MYTLDGFIRQNDKENKVKEAIIKCFTENMTKQVALDTLANDIQERLYHFIDSNELYIDDGNNIQRDFTKAIRDVLTEYFDNIEQKEVEEHMKGFEDCKKVMKAFGIENVKLPCKVGDELYRIYIAAPIHELSIETYIVDNILICEDEILYKYDAYDGVICTLDNILHDKLYADCYRIFTSREEAEKTLEAMRYAMYAMLDEFPKLECIDKIMDVIRQN